MTHTVIIVLVDVFSVSAYCCPCCHAMLLPALKSIFSIGSFVSIASISSGTDGVCCFQWRLDAAVASGAVLRASHSHCQYCNLISHSKETGVRIGEKASHKTYCHFCLSSEVRKCAGYLLCTI